MNDKELYYATGRNDIEVVDRLLSRGAKIDEKQPQYLNCKSIECIKVYRKHGIDLNGCDEQQSNLLHDLAWADLPEVFDFAYSIGIRWIKDSSHRTPYTLAKQGRRKIADHFKANYPELLTNKIENNDTGSYKFERIFFLKQSISNPNCFIGLTLSSKLIRYVKEQDELIIDKVVEIDVPIIRNFTFDKNENLIIPTADSKLLVVDQVNFQLLYTIDIEEGLDLDQITYVPSKNIYIGSSVHWKIDFLDEDFKKNSQVNAESGTFWPELNQPGNLISFYSYNQETFINLYEFTDNLEIKFIRSFYKDYDNPSRGFGFNDNEFAVSFPHVFEYYRFVNGKVEMLWEMDISQFQSEHHLSYLTFINANLIVLGKGKTLFYIDNQQQKIVREERLDLLAEIRDLSLDNEKENLIISTDEELKLLSLKGRKVAG